jgi:hypothetical protein
MLTVEYLVTYVISVCPLILLYQFEKQPSTSGLFHKHCCHAFCFAILTECQGQGLNCQKISGGLTSAYSLSLSLHTGNSASLTTAGGLKLTPPPGYPRASCLGGGG